MKVRRQLQLISECLEPRTMLSSVTLVGDRVIAIGTPGDDSIEFSVNGNDVYVNMNGRSFGPFTAPRRLEARGLAGDDSIQVLDTGTVIPVEFHGDDGGDTLGGAAGGDFLSGDGGARILSWVEMARTRSREIAAVICSLADHPKILWTVVPSKTSSSVD